MMKSKIKGILKILRAALLSPISLLFYLCAVMCGTVFFISQITVLVVIALGVVSILSVKEFILP